MEIDPTDDDVATPHTAHSSALHSINEITNIRDVEGDRGRGRERKALGGLTAAQASTDNRQSHPHHLSVSLSQPLPLPTSLPVRTTSSASTSTGRNVRAVSTSSTGRSTVEDRSSNATFRIFSDIAGTKKQYIIVKE